MDNQVYIIGGGSSLKDFDFKRLKDKTTICVNKSIFDVPNPDYFITMDYSFLNKIDLKKFRKIKCPKIFIVDLDLPYMTEQGGKVFDVRTGITYHFNEFDIVIKSKFTKGIGFKWNEFYNGLHSGFCGIQFASLMGYENIYLLGYDYNKEGDIHYHDSYEGKTQFRQKCDEYLDHMQIGLQELMIQKINVVSCSKNSLLNNFLEYEDI